MSRHQSFYSVWVEGWLGPHIAVLRMIPGSVKSSLLVVSSRPYGVQGTLLATCKASTLPVLLSLQLHTHCYFSTIEISIRKTNNK